MTREEKYKAWENIFYKYFIYKSDDSSESGSNLPLASVNFDNLSGFSGDGIIDLSYYIQYVYTKYLLNGDNSELIYSIKVLSRLQRNCYKLFLDKYPSVYFKEEKGFLLRDDIEYLDAPKFHLESVDTSYTRGEELINEDPCHSMFISQDQIWNVVPILVKIYKELEDYKLLCLPGFKMLEYVIKHKHVIYNPYYSALYHHWTYVPTFDTNRVKPWNRIEDRNKHLKNTIKVKRGANNWYFAYGFRKAFQALGGKCETFWHSLWYKPFIFLADRIYHPYICKWLNLPVKNTSYYSLAVAGGAWYFGDYESRLIDKFNKSLESEELFMPQLVFLTNKKDKINLNLLGKWLDNYPEPKEEGNVESPIIFLLLYNWDKIMKNNV